MKNVVSLVITCLLCIGASLLPAQTHAMSDTRFQELVKNHMRLNTQPEEAFGHARQAEKKAQKSKDREAELWAIHTQTAYHYMRNDFEQIIINSRRMYEKASEYKMPTYQAMAKTYMFYPYMYNSMPEEAVRQLDEAMNLINGIKEQGTAEIMAKANIYLTYGQFYADTGKKDKLMEYVNLSLSESDKLPESEIKEQIKFTNHTNLATAYKLAGNYDAAKHYAEMSLESAVRYNNIDVQQADLSILGQVAEQNGNYDTAIRHLQDAEKLNDKKSNPLLQDVYAHLIKCFHIQGDKENTKLYEAKLDSTKLILSESKNRFLTKLLNEKDEGYGDIWIYALAAMLISATAIAVFASRRAGIRKVKQEKEEKQHLDTINSEKADNSRNYQTLISMLQEKNPAFMLCFDETFPGFSDSLRTVCPNLSASELEFCAMLKLNLSTKEIASYKFIEPGTVRNKKYSLKKKLHIPNDKNLYQWLGEL